MLPVRARHARLPPAAVRHLHMVNKPVRQGCPGTSTCIGILLTTHYLLLKHCYIMHGLVTHQGTLDVQCASPGRRCCCRSSIARAINNCCEKRCRMAQHACAMQGMRVPTATRQGQSILTGLHQTYTVWVTQPPCSSGRIATLEYTCAAAALLVAGH